MLVKDLKLVLSIMQDDDEVMVSIEKEKYTSNYEASIRLEQSEEQFLDRFIVRDGCVVLEGGI